MPETKSYIYTDKDGISYDVPIDVTLPLNLVPAVANGWVRSAKRRMAVADIINKQAQKYPTVGEQGGKAGTPVTGPSAAEVQDYSPSKLLGYAASGASDVLGQAASSLNRPRVGPMSIQQMKQAPPLENVEGLADTMATSAEQLSSSDPRTRAAGAM